jgi:hypothetical protein
MSYNMYDEGQRKCVSDIRTHCKKANILKNGGSQLCKNDLKNAGVWQNSCKHEQDAYGHFGMLVKEAETKMVDAPKIGMMDHFNRFKDKSSGMMDSIKDKSSGMMDSIKDKSSGMMSSFKPNEMLNNFKNKSYYSNNNPPAAAPPLQGGKSKRKQSKRKQSKRKQTKRKQTKRKQTKRKR